MDLWQLFPSSLLSVHGILSLPYLTLPIYFVVTLILIKAPSQRLALAVFLILSLLASLLMLVSMGPGIDTVYLPLLLLMVMIMPLLLLCYAIYRFNKLAIRVWAVASIAGILHSLSWSMWLFALAGS